MDEHGWWLRFADNTYPKGSVRDSGSVSHCWEQINGKWWAFDETGYAKTGWLRDEDYGGWFYMDLEHGMQTGWVLIILTRFPMEREGLCTPDKGHRTDTM